MRVLFVTRKFPPSIGGMQRLSFQLASGLQKRVDLSVISWGGSQLFLPWFFPLALFKAVFAFRMKKDLVLLGDPIMSPIGFLLKKMFDCPTVITVHGLDITFSFPFYQSIVPRFVDQCDQVICISENTRQFCVNRGISESKCRIVHPGVELVNLPGRESSRRWLEIRLGRSLNNVTVLLTVGRLVRRKGVNWFIENVMPKLSSCSNCLYIVAGSGPEEQKIRRMIEDANLRESVVLLGRIPEAHLSCLYRGSDIFLMPNLQVGNDVEGFGLVALEAAAHSLPVVAADLEGIRDAVNNRKIGNLLKSKDADTWITHLKNLLEKPEKLTQLGKTARLTVAAENSWAKTVDRYVEVFESVID